MESFPVDANGCEADSDVGAFWRRRLYWICRRRGKDKADRAKVEEDQRRRCHDIRPRYCPLSAVAWLRESNVSPRDRGSTHITNGA